MSFIKSSGLQFKPYDEFKAKAITERGNLYRGIAKKSGTQTTRAPRQRAAVDVNSRNVATLATRRRRRTATW